MANYRHILICVDLSEEAKQVADRARAVANANDTRVSLIHVIEPLSFAYGGDIPMDFSGVQEEIEKQAETHLQSFAKDYDVGEQDQHVVVGRAESEIHRFAIEQEADLIVVGSHGKHGLALLLGSTANGVLHGAHCDVLAVRVK